MAMALRTALPAFDPAQVSILATDLNEASLAFARAALYRDWSFRRTPPAMRAAWFTGAGAGLYALRPEIRKLVRFARLNLAEPVYPSPHNATQAMDVIFCRNVLMYFSRRQMRLAIARLRECLVDGGWLVVNPSEASAELFEGFRAVCYPDAILYQKAAPLRSAAGDIVRPAARAGAPVLAPAPAVRAAAGDAAAACVGAAGGMEAAPAQALRQASALVRGGARPAALQLLARAANASPLSPQLHQAAAGIALELGDFAAARRHLQRQLYLEPGSILGHYLSGVACLGAGQRKAALRAFGASEALLAGLADDLPVPGADGWRAAGLRMALRACTGSAA